MKRAARTIAAVTGVVLWSSLARAQSPDKDADAERFFREGQKLMEAHRYGEACPKFEAAYKKDHQLGTLLNLAYCHKEQGAVWLAWVEFKEAELKAIELKRNDRRDFARQRMAELEKSLARVVVEPTQKVVLTEVLVDDRRVPDAERSVAFAAEPGQRKLTFRAKGMKQVVELVTIVKRDRAQRIAVPAMEVQEVEPVAEEPSRQGEGDDDAAPVAPPRGEASSDGSGRRTLALALVGVGVVGVGVGAVTGLMTLSNECARSGREENPAGCPNTDEGRERAAQGQTTGMISTVSFGVGGAALVTALVLYLTAPSASSRATAGVSAKPPAAGLHVTPEIGTGWAGLRGVF